MSTTDSIRATAELGDRRLFPDLTPRVYANHAAVSPPSRPVQQAVSAMLQEFAERGLDAWGDAVEQRDRLRGKLARMLDAAPDDVALRAGTTTGIQDVALCYPWNYGDRLVLFEGEFPGNVTPWQQAQGRSEWSACTSPWRGFTTPRATDSPVWMECCGPRRCDWWP